MLVSNSIDCDEMAAELEEKRKGNGTMDLEDQVDSPCSSNSGENQQEMKRRKADDGKSTYSGVSTTTSSGGEHPTTEDPTEDTTLNTDPDMTLSASATSTSNNVEPHHKVNENTVDAVQKDAVPEDDTTKTTKLPPINDLGDFPQDAYSMIYLAHWQSRIFIISMLVFFLQILILVLCLVDLMDDNGENDGNLFNVSTTATPTIWAAQFVAVFIAVLSQDDVTVSLLFISFRLGKDRSTLFQFEKENENYKGCKEWQFWLGTLLRLFEGLFVIFVSVVFILQSETVLDIFLNFAAIEFVSELDNLGYGLAREGWFGEAPLQLAYSIGEEKVPKRRVQRLWRIILLVTILFALLCGWVAVLVRQDNGHFIVKDACSFLDVKFGDEVFAFPVGTEFNATEISNGNLLPNSNRRLPPAFDPKSPPDLHYAYFSGRYEADFHNKAGVNNPRPVYYEANRDEQMDHDDSTLGIFYYCEEENAWVWSVRAFDAVGLVPPETKERCKHGWLLRSPDTEAVTLEEVPSGAWRIWTGVLATAFDFSFACVECDSDLACSGSKRGTCGNDGVCECRDGYDGDFCEQDKPCPHLFEVTRSSGLYALLRGKAYGRPVYFGDGLLSRGNGTVHEVLVFTGRRWFNLELTDKYYNDIQDDDNHLHWHAYWGNLLLESVKWYSETTNSFLPIGSLKWYEIAGTHSVGSYGQFGRELEARLRNECLSVSCDESRRICGIHGTCEKNQTLVFGGSNLVNITGGKCHCEEEYFGHYCEYHLSELTPIESYRLNGFGSSHDLRGNYYGNTCVPGFNDIYPGGYFPAKDMEECFAFCEDHENCVTADYQLSNRRCYPSTASKASSKDCEDYTMYVKAERVNGVSSVEYHRCIPGGNDLGGCITQDSLEACIETCTDKPECATVDYHRYNGNCCPSTLGFSSSEPASVKASCYDYVMGVV